MTDPNEYKIFQLAKQQGKDDSFIKGAIQAYRTKKTPTAPATPNEAPQGFLSKAGSALKSVGGFIASNEVNFGNDIAGAILPMTKDYKDAVAHPSVKGEDLDPTLKKSNWQVVGDAAGVALDIATAGSYSKAAAGARTGRFLSGTARTAAQVGLKETAKKTGEVIAQKAPSTLARFGKGFVRGAIANGAIGGATGTAQGLSSGQDATGVATTAIESAVFNAVTGGLAQGTFVARKGDPQAIKDAAANQYKKALGATKEKYRELSDKVIPDLLKEGRWGTRNQLLAGAMDKQKLAGDAYEKLGKLQGTAEIGGIQAKIDAEMGKLVSPNGSILSINKTKYEALQGLKNDIQGYQIMNEIGKNGGPVAAQEQLRSLAAQYGDTLYETRKSFKTVGDNATLSQVQKVDGAIRDLLSTNNPDYAKINKVYTLNTRLADIINASIDRDGSGRGFKELISRAWELGTVTTGAATSLATGNVTPLIASIVIPAIAEITSSTWYRTMRAVQKDRLAEKLLAMPAVQRNQALIALQRNGAKYAGQLLGIMQPPSQSQDN